MGEEREMGRLEAKVDMLITNVTELREDMKNNYMPRSELEPRLQRLEGSPQRFFTNLLSLASVGIALWAALGRH